MNELKKTELWLIPKEWEVKKLVEISNINPENLPKETNNETIINYIDIESVLTGKILNIKKILFKSAPSRARRVIIKDDIIISTVRPYLKAIAMINTDSENLVCSTGFAVVRAKNNVLPKYIYQCILDDNFNNQLISKMVGSNYPAVTSKDIEQALLLIPPINEQNKIASILSTVDDLIENTDHIINSYTLLKKGLMQTLLTKGIGHTKFKKTVIGEIPEEWKISKLEEITTRIIVGLATSVTKHYRKTGIPIIRNLNIKNCKLDDSNMLYLDEKFAKTQKSKEVFAGDIITTHTGYIGVSCIVPEKYNKAQTFTTLITTTNKDLLLPGYFVQHINSSIGNREIRLLKVGGGRDNLNVKEFKNYRIALPPIYEQQKIASILSLIDDRLELYKLEKEKFNLLKKGLMKQLLTGKIRVKV